MKVEEQKQTEPEMSLARKAWKKVRNRSSRNLRDGGLLIGSSRLIIRLRSFGNQHELINALVRNSKDEIVSQGLEAEQMAERLPDGLHFQRPFREGRVEDLDGAKKLLQKLLGDARHRVIMGPRLMIGVGSHLTNLEKRTITELAKVAGARSVDLVECAVLSVVGAGLDPSTSAGHMVVDLGAGHAEIALVASGKVKFSRSIPELGRRLDQAIRDTLRKEEDIEVSLSVAESLKKKLGSAKKPTELKTENVGGVDTQTRLPCTRTVDSFLVYRAMQPLLLEVVEETRQLFKEIPMGFVADVANSGIILVGSLAQIDHLPEELAERTNLECHRLSDPGEVTRKGLDRVLGDSRLRAAILNPDKSNIHGVGRSGRGTEKLAGLLAVALLLVATYFPSEQIDGLKMVDDWKESLTPVLSIFNPPDEEAIRASFQSEMAEKDRQLAVMQKNYESLNKTKDLRTKPPVWAARESVVGRVVARAPESWNELVAVDVGTSAGVEKGMTVTNEDGLVGQVEQVGSGSSKVKLFSSLDQDFGGYIARTKTNGVVTRTSGGGLALTFIDPNDGVKVGDTVKTNGLEKTFPAGVPVAKVTQLRRDEGEHYLVADLQPQADIDSLDSVIVLSTEEI